MVSPDWTFIDGGVFGLTEKKIDLVHLQPASSFFSLGKVNPSTYS